MGYRSAGGAKQVAREHKDGVHGFQQLLVQ